MQLYILIPPDSDEDIVVEFQGNPVAFETLKDVGDFITIRTWRAIRLRAAPDKVKVSYTFPLGNRDDVQPQGALQEINDYLANGWQYADPPIRGDWDVETQRFKHTVYLEKEKSSDELV